MEILILAAGIIAGMFLQSKISAQRRADKYEQLMATRAAWYQSRRAPIYHFSAHPFDTDVEQRAEFDRVQLAAIGKSTIPVFAIPYGGLGLKKTSHAGENFDSEYLPRLFSELFQHRNAMAEDFANGKGSTAANTVFAGQRMDAGEWQYVNPSLMAARQNARLAR